MFIYIYIPLVATIFRCCDQNVEPWDCRACWCDNKPVGSPGSWSAPRCGCQKCHHRGLMGFSNLFSGNNRLYIIRSPSVEWYNNGIHVYVYPMVNFEVSKMAINSQLRLSQDRSLRGWGGDRKGPPGLGSIEVPSIKSLGKMRTSPASSMKNWGKRWNHGESTSLWILWPYGR